ncbi:MAG TPA: hypothetical protein VKV96_03665 [Roseiarcus sp.]|nr:hypothetical protein [Roseiarcus sp.]
MRAKSEWIIVAAAFALFAAASTQASPADSGDQTSAQPPKTDLQDKKGDLSEKLDKSNGVIHPKGAVDPGMAKKAPPVGNTPVIPPPNAPRSGTNAEPK